jgi:ankyrin repeat protein
MTRRLDWLVSEAVSARGSGQQTAAPVADAASAEICGGRTLLKQGADASMPQPDGMTPLHWAAERGETAMADALILSGANVTAVTRRGIHAAPPRGAQRQRTVLRALLKAGPSRRFDVYRCGPALHFAAEAGSIESINALMDAGADANARDAEFGQTPLVFAVSAGQWTR